NPAIANIHFVLTPALAAEPKQHLRAFDLCMTIFKCGQTERLIFARVFFVSDAYERSLQKPHDCREHFLPRQTRQFQILSNSPANIRQSFGELSEALELVFVARFAPSLVIAVLLAATRVATRRLDVAICRRTNPNLCPGRGNGQTLYPKQPLLVANRFSFRVQILEVFAFRSAAVTRPFVIDISQTGFLRSLRRISRDGGF